MSSFLANWYLHIPSLLLAAIIYLLIGRLVLSFLLSEGGLVMRALAAITNPVVATVGAITPRVVSPAAVIVCAVAWLCAARVAVLWVAMVRGVRL